MRQRTKLMHALRAHMAELGIIAETGLEGLAKLVNFVALMPARMVHSRSQW